MSAVSVNPPFPIFTDTDGQPLENGYIWIGATTLDPQGNPINVYWDAALTQVAGQPIRTSGGYPVRNGSPARIYTGSDYSIRVQNKNGSTVYSASASTDFVSAVDVSFQPAGAGAVSRTVQSKLRDTVSVKDFGAKGDGVADDSAAFTAAFAASTFVYVPAGTYKAAFEMPNYGRLIGDGILVTQIIPPAGATAVITVDSTVSTTKSWINIEDVRIYNPNSVSNCVGIFFKGTDVNTIMDYSRLNRVEVSYFDIGIRITGRMIGAYWTHVNCLYNRIGMKVNTDTANVSFILNTFVECYWNDSIEEGLRVETWNLMNKFISCNWQYNNTGDVAGVAESYFGANNQLLSFDKCYWESTAAVAVDTSNPANNSISCRLDGSGLTTNPSFDGCYFAGSGCNLLIDADVLFGGHIKESALACNTGGFSIAVVTEVNQGAAQDQFRFDHSNTYSGQIRLKAPIGDQFAAYIEQQKGMFYGGNPASIDLMRFSKFVINTATGVTIPTPSNMIPGCEMYIKVFGGGSVTVPAAIMDTGVNEVVASGANKTFMAMPFPWIGKFAVVS